MHDLAAICKLNESFTGIKFQIIVKPHIQEDLESS